ncbi:hypothetical protein AB0J47_27685, partial [Nocardia sp. NPDC049737]
KFQAVSSRRKHPDHRGFCQPDRYGKPTGFGIAKVTRVKRATNADNGFRHSTSRPSADDRSGELVGAAAATGGADDPWAVNAAGSFGGGSGTEPPF